MPLIPNPTGQPLMGTAETAALLGVSRQRVSQLARHPGFPEPVARLAAGPIWNTTDVLAWSRAREQRKKPPRV